MAPKAAPPVMAQASTLKKDLSSVQQQLAEARENLRLIRERISAFVVSTDVPLQLVKEENRLCDEIAGLEQQLAAQPAEDSEAGPRRAVMETAPERSHLINPFIYGPPVPPEKFIGRETEVGFILGRLANPNNRGGTTVSGESGIGKTSLLHYLFAEDTRRRWAGLSPDVAHFVFIPTGFISPFSEIEFWEYLFNELKDWLDPTSEAEKIVKSIESEKLPTRFDVSKFFSTLGQDKNKFVIVLLDGFDLLIEEIRQNETEAGLGFLHTLRALLNLPAPRGFSLIPSSERNLFDLLKDMGWFGSDFCSNMADLRLGPFSETDIGELVDTYLAETGIDFDKEDRSFLKEISSGHPQRLQQAAYLLFEKKQVIEKVMPEAEEETFVPDPGLIQVITDASTLLVEIARDVFKTRQAKRQKEATPAESRGTQEASGVPATPPALPIDQIDEMEAILQQIDLASQEMRIDAIESLVSQLNHHKRTWNDYCEEESKPTASAAARVEAKQLREDEEILIRSKGLSLKQQIEKLTGHPIELPGLE